MRIRQGLDPADEAVEQFFLCAANSTRIHGNSGDAGKHILDAVVEFTDQQLPSLLRALALDKVRSLAGEQIQCPEGALIRSERRAVMRRKHAQHMARAADKGGRLNSSHASPELNTQRWSADEDRTLLDVLDDNALAAF